jgi:midasin
LTVENRKRAQQAHNTEEQTAAKKAKREMKSQLKEKWRKFITSVSKFEIQHEQIKNNFAFAFIEGASIKALKKGYWVLLDEINLASPETLEVIYVKHSSVVHMPHTN